MAFMKSTFFSGAWFGRVILVQWVGWLWLGMGVGAAEFEPMAQTPFLKESKSVPARREWDREIVSRAGGTVRFRVSCPRPFGVSIIADEALQDLKRGVKKRLGKEDVALTVDCREPSLERTLKLGKGSWHFIIENQSDQVAEVRLECWQVKE